jgi:GDPmannose 4,6-dehydratase
MNKESYDLMRILSIEEAKKFLSERPVVIITGVTGQDGSFMVDYLLKHTNCEIFGGARRLSVANHDNIKHLYNTPRFHLINFDLTDAHSISQAISVLKPRFFINLAAQSFVKSSWDFPLHTWETNTTGVLHILEAMRLHCPTSRFYNAGSSEEFGDVSYSPQDENHPIRPRSPYGASKAAARQLVKVYRESYDMYAIQGWLFNHEGIRRGEEFVTRKITKGVAQISKEINTGTTPTPLVLGNLDAVRDWSDAEDMVDAIWRMLNQDVYRQDIADIIKDFDKTGHILLPREINPAWHSIVVKNLREYVVGSGETHTIREFVSKSFDYAGIVGHWVKGQTPLEETFVSNNTVLVKVNKSFYRPAEVEYLHANPSLIKKELGWNPQTTFEGLVKKMVHTDSI